MATVQISLFMLMVGGIIILLIGMGASIIFLKGRFHGRPITELKYREVYFREEFPKNYMALIRQENDVLRVYDLDKIDQTKLPDAFFVTDKGVILPWEPIRASLDFELGEGSGKEEDPDSFEFPEKIPE